VSPLAMLPPFLKHPFFNELIKFFKRYFTRNFSQKTGFRAGVKVYKIQGLTRRKALSFLEKKLLDKCSLYMLYFERD